MGAFEGDLAFQAKMRPAALRIYSALWPACNVENLRKDGPRVHVLDKEFGIDTVVTTRTGQWFTIQEKYRRFDALRWGDFTQEYKNAVGMPGEAPGEWFTLGAQLYFYGWADKDETSFLKWFLMNVPAYKAWVEDRGGLDRVGRPHRNDRHGRSIFYSIPVSDLRGFFVACGPSSAWVGPPAERVPRFKTDEEEARYWDTHDLADHWDELEVTGDVHFDLPPADHGDMRQSRMFGIE